MYAAARAFVAGRRGNRGRIDAGPGSVGQFLRVFSAGARSTGESTADQSQSNRTAGRSVYRVEEV
jgi:hypothetical protein